MTGWTRERRHEYERGASPAPRSLVAAFWSVALLAGLVWAGVAGIGR